MKEATKPQSVYTKINAARKILRSQKLTKSGRNDFAHYNYFELGDFLPQSLDAFDEVGLAGVVNFDPDLASLAIVDIESGESITIHSPMSTAELKGCHAVQNLGAVQTYLRRYLWSAAMELIESDPLDGSKPLDNGGKEQLPQRPVKVPPRSPQRQAEGSYHDNWRGFLEEVKMHDSRERKDYTGKPYILYRAIIDEEHQATTFDEDLYKTAKACFDNNDEVRMRVTPNKRKPGTWELIAIQKVEDEQQEEEWK